MAKFYVPVSYDKHRRANFKLLSRTVIRIMLGHFRSFRGQDIKLTRRNVLSQKRGILVEKNSIPDSVHRGTAPGAGREPSVLHL